MSEKNKNYKIICNNKGITLVALIITIVVMLILASVTINQIKGNGIIKHAKSATESFDDTQIEEDIRMLQLEQQQIEEYGVDYDIEAKIKEKEWCDTVSISDDGTIIVTAKNGKTYVATSSGIEVQKQLSDYGNEVKIGDYVDYKEASSGTYTTDTNKGIGGGRDTTQSTTTATTEKFTLTEKTYETEDLKWRILGVNKKGELELISDTPHSVAVYIANEDGYVYGPDELNKMCNTLYGNGTNNNNKKVAVSARSLNVEDINNLINPGYSLTNYEEYGYIWTYRFQESGTNMEYKTTDASGKVITDWTAITGDDSQTFRMPKEETTISSSKPGTSKPLINNRYILGNISNKMNTETLNMIKTDSSNLKQWLASTYMNFGNFVSFQLYFLQGSSLQRGRFIYASNERNYLWPTDGALVRPVVTLKTSVKLNGGTNTTHTTEDTAWTIE